MIDRSTDQPITRR